MTLGHFSIYLFLFLFLNLGDLEGNSSTDPGLAPLLDSREDNTPKIGQISKVESGLTETDCTSEKYQKKRKVPQSMLLDRRDQSMFSPCPRGVTI